jgi:small-conductance mechanosensitive channel
MVFKKTLFKSTFFIIFISIIVGCYLWLTCRNFCVSTLLNNRETIVQGTWLLTKKILLLFILFIVFKTIKHVVLKSIKYFLAKTGKADKFSTIKKLISFSIWTVFGISALSIFLGDLTALVASLGLVGFGLTFALQKPILNFVGWLIILFKEIYSEGDRIRINNIVGDVKEIQVMNTILEGLLESSDVLSGKVISFPNELILSTDIQNFTKDSNYLVNELKIAITYESNYHKARSLLEKIITEHISRNRSKYIKKINKQKSHVNYMISKWLNTRDKVSKKEEREKGGKQIENLKNEEEKLHNDLQKLDEEFKPMIRVEMLDSAIELIAQFKCPYNEIKQNRTQINLQFLDAIRKEVDIEIAYPHLQIIKK